MIYLRRTFNAVGSMQLTFILWDGRPGNHHSLLVQRLFQRLIYSFSLSDMTVPKGTG